MKSKYAGIAQRLDIIEAVIGSHLPSAHPKDRVKDVQAIRSYIESLEKRARVVRQPRPARADGGER